jgi:hypothetical protein
MTISFHSFDFEERKENFGVTRKKESGNKAARVSNFVTSFSHAS